MQNSNITREELTLLQITAHTTCCYPVSVIVGDLLQMCMFYAVKVQNDMRTNYFSFTCQKTEEQTKSTAQLVLKRV